MITLVFKVINLIFLNMLISSTLIFCIIVLNLFLSIVSSFKIGIIIFIILLGLFTFFLPARNADCTILVADVIVSANITVSNIGKSKPSPKQ